MKIITMHGIASHHEGNKQIYRSYAPAPAFKKYLAERSRPFQMWEDNGANTAVLTVDDATRAGEAACLMARAAGHEVYLFINPYQVMYQQPYWFSMFNIVLDKRTVEKVILYGKPYQLTTFNDVNAFRKVVKKTICLQSPAEAMAMVKEMAQLLKAGAINDADLPAHARTLTIKQLRALRQAGVHIESHGWDHTDINAFSAEQLLRDIEDSAAWIRTELGVSPSLYAIPFGDTDLPPSVKDKIGIHYFLANPDLAQGRLHDNAWNRIDITRQLC
jgi:Polysaccharide deacetylase